MAQDFEAQPLADADGCVETLYNYLWQKNGAGRSCPGLNVPETIVYKYRQPAYWFFTSVQDKQLKKKNRVNIVNARIFDSFTKRKSSVYQGVDVCSYHIYSSENDDGTPHGRHETSSDITTIEYFDEASFRQFLFHGEKTANGVLQKFVPAKGENQTVIRATWSPQVCLLERRVNNHKLRDNSIEMYQRCVTFDGQEHLSTSSPLTGTSFAAQIQFVCNSIVEHVFEVSNRRYRISRMICNFKLDADNKLWFLWCSSLRLAKSDQTAQPAQPVNLDPNFVVKPKSRFLIQPKKGPPVLQHSYFKCPGCKEVHEVRNKYEVTYKAVLQHWEKQQSDKSRSRQFSITGTNRGQEMPPILASCEPKLTLEKFEVVRSDPTFLYRSAAMCETCCLQHNHTALTTLEKDTSSGSGLQRPLSRTVAGNIGGGLGGNPPWVPPRETFLALQDTHWPVPTKENITKKKPAQPSPSKAAPKPRAESARMYPSRSKAMTPDGGSAPALRLQRPPSAPPHAPESKPQKGAADEEVSPREESPTKEASSTREQSPYKADLVKESSLDRMINAATGRGRRSPTKETASSPIRVRAAAAKDPYVQTTYPSPKRGGQRAWDDTTTVATSPDPRPLSSRPSSSRTQSPSRELLKPAHSNIYAAYSDRLTEKHGMPSHAHALKHEAVKDIYKPNRAPPSATIARQPTLATRKPPRVASAGPSRPTARTQPRVQSARAASSTSRGGAGAPEPKSRIKSAGPAGRGGNGRTASPADLTMSQEELVRQAVANAGMAGVGDGKGIGQELDSLLEGLSMEPSEGAATQAYNQMVEQNRREQAEASTAASIDGKEGNYSVDAEAASALGSANQGGAVGSAPEAGVMADMTEEEKTFLLNEVGDIGAGDVM